ncbi:hypothetical protein NAEGRDRAFT_77678 [Naegleria gruberi]|uniref:Mic1 domain-containing protein n=1 Tax=Naegleria gruberi TaxID=5762 RepID=D2UXI3_NAEGR|nr:uncharacterized protein NAEGRDRAFT_77678 [Naegleria gruberi]EFC50637.1 hypothetical protein NAEGRDRAFT_77678 [Naegleria gruberi]|eukprot:XP_002683381.1 hypothetical protein NAEGRDRAFT_77678 [Naegleria gruberi strain NEG-M]
MTKKRSTTPSKAAPNITSPTKSLPPSNNITESNTSNNVESDTTNYDLINNTSSIKCILSCDKSLEGKINNESIKEIIGLESSSQYILSVKQENDNFSFTRFEKLKDQIENLTTYSTKSNSSRIYFNNDSLVYYTKNKSSITEHTVDGNQSKIVNHVKDIKFYQIVKNIFENEFIHINHEHVLHTIQGSSISISLKKLLTNVEQYEYKYSTESCLIYLDISTNTLFSYNFIKDQNTKLVTFKKLFKNINISKYDNDYLLLTMNNQNSTIIQIWNKDLTTVMKYALIKNNLRFVAYNQPFVIFDKCLFKMFKFDGIKFTKAIQIKNRKLTNIFVDSHKTDNGFVFSIHDSSQWNKIETELQQKRLNILDALLKNSSNLLEYIKQLPLIEYYQILLEHVFNNISNDNVLPCLDYLLSNYTQIERSDGMTSIHIGIMNKIVNYLLDNYSAKYRTSLNLIVKLLILSDEQIIRYISIYNRENYQEGLRLVLNSQYRNVQLLSMMKFVKTLDFEAVVTVLNLLKDEAVHIESCMVWTQILVHSHFGEFLLKKDCLEVIQTIQTRIKSSISQLKQLSLVKSELGIISSGMVLPKKKEKSKEKLLLNGARWNSGETDYNISLNYF